MTQHVSGPDELGFVAQISRATDRRSFLRWSGLTVGVLALGACGNDSTSPEDAVDLGSGDVGVLNYAYALEQLEYEFYRQVVATPYSGISQAERSILTDLRDHELIHRDFFRTALGSAAIPSLDFTFESINFSNRSSVLNAAKAFEDLGVSAYNFAGQLLSDPNNLLVAGKIVSVEARHASAIRDLLNPGSTDFAGDDVVDPVSGLDLANAPSVVLAANAAGAFVRTPITFGNLPTS